MNPYLGVVFQFIPKLVNGYAAKGVEEKSDHGVVFQRQLAFLNEHHGPVLVAFVALGAAWMLWRIFRPRPEDTREQRLGSILVLSLLLGYSILHSLGMTLFRGQLPARGALLFPRCGVGPGRAVAGAGAAASQSSPGGPWRR